MSRPRNAETAPFKNTAFSVRSNEEVNVSPMPLLERTVAAVNPTFDQEQWALQPWQTLSAFPKLLRAKEDVTLPSCPTQNEV